MYLLDTNVISELRKSKTNKIDRRVETWVSGTSSSELFLSVITILELEMGILSAERRDASKGALLRSWLSNHVFPAFTDRILTLDVAIAQRCAKLHIPDPRSDRDAMIAATGLIHGMTVVTRNVNDFEKTGVEILNPWDA